MSWTSTEPRTPLTELEEAILIALTGCTGLTMPDRPFADPRDGKPIMAKPNLNMAGRTAGSPDNAQGTHFFLINDSGTYFLRKLPPPDRRTPSVFDEETLLARAAEAKVQLLDHRIDVPDGNRDFPAYLDSNRFLSNLPGTTILFPVVDLSRQYINGMMYLLTQPDGRPADDRRRPQLLPAGGREEVGEVRVPEQGHQAAARHHLGDAHADRGRPAAAEPDAHRRRDGPRAPGSTPRSRRRSCSATRSSASSTAPMLGFDWSDAQVEAGRHPALAGPAAEVRRTCARAAVGLRHKGEHLIKAMCPPNYDTHGRRGRRGGGRQVRPERDLHRRGAVRRASTRASSAPSTCEEASNYSADVIACARDICTYIYETHGRFPAHCDTIHVPGVWLQAHHVENGYYEKFFRNGLTEAHQLHDQRWHSESR